MTKSVWNHCVLKSGMVVNLNPGSLILMVSKYDMIERRFVNYNGFSYTYDGFFLHQLVHDNCYIYLYEYSKNPESFWDFGKIIYNLSEHKFINDFSSIEYSAILDDEYFEERFSNRFAKIKIEI